MLPIIVAGSRPAAAVLAQRWYFDCDTSVELHRLQHASITDTGRSRVSTSSPVLLDPIGSHRPPDLRPNRHRARSAASRIPSRDFLLWRFSNAGPSRRVRRAVRHGPASENLHNSRHPNYSITCVALAMTEAGISIPSERAVIILITKSNWLGCSTGMSVGRPPFNILST